MNKGAEADMDLKQAALTYKKTSIDTMPAVEYVQLLLRTCSKYMEEAKHAILSGEIELRNHSISRAQELVVELISATDPSKVGGKRQIALCEFISRRMVEAHIKKDIDILEEAQKLIDELAALWDSGNIRRKN